MASGFARKNPCAAIRAFRQAFGDDRSVRLLVKYANEDAFREGVASLRIESAAAENIVLIGGTLRPPELAALYDQADVLLSLHRSEGFGLTLAEAMLRQIPVIATNWSGNTDFLTSETGIPIGYRLVPAQDPQQTYNHPDMVWADPDVHEAAIALRRLRSDPMVRKQLAANAYAVATRLFNSDAYAEKVQAVYRSLLGCLGQRGARKSPAARTADSRPCVIRRIRSAHASAFDPWAIDESDATPLA